MDPLSITASAVGLSANIIRAAVAVKDAVNEFQDAPAVARDIEDEIRIVHAALRQVEAALQRDGGAIWRFQLDDVFSLSVEGCEVLLTQIEDEFDSLFGRADWRARLSIWWNGGEVRRLLGRLGTKKASLMLLVQALGLNSMREMHDLLHNNRTTLDIARLGLEDMVPKYPAYAPRDIDSRASVIGSDDGLLGDRESVLSNTRFVFDEVLFGSNAYRHTVARVSAKKNGGHGVRSNPPDLPTVPEGRMELKKAISERTSTPNTPSVVSSDVHEAILMKLREAEERIRALEEQMQNQGAATPGPQEAVADQLHIDSGGQPKRKQPSAEKIVERKPLVVPIPPAGTKPSVVSSPFITMEDAEYAPPRPPKVPNEDQDVADEEREWAERAAKAIWGTSSPRQNAEPSTEGQLPTAPALPLATWPDIYTTRETLGGLASQRPRRVPVRTENVGRESGLLEATPLLEHADPAQPYSLPTDGTPITIKTRHRGSRSQTSLLLEYFEGGKATSQEGENVTGHKKPSVRVRLTPSSKPKSRTASGGRSLEIEQRGRVNRSVIENEENRLFRPTAVDIETAISSIQSGSLLHDPVEERPLPSGVSSIPACSFLDDPMPSVLVEGEKLQGSNAAGQKDSVSPQGGVEVFEQVQAIPLDETPEPVRKARKPKRRPKLDADGNILRSRKRSPRRATKVDDHSQQAPDGGNLLPESQRASVSRLRDPRSRASTINNPKLLETVEDAIRRLILPELNALKREQALKKKQAQQLQKSWEEHLAGQYMLEWRKKLKRWDSVNPLGTISENEEGTQEESSVATGEAKKNIMVDTNSPPERVDDGCYAALQAKLPPRSDYATPLEQQPAADIACAPDAATMGATLDGNAVWTSSPPIPVPKKVFPTDGVVTTTDDCGDGPINRAIADGTAGRDDRGKGTDMTGSYSPAVAANTPSSQGKRSSNVAWGLHDDLSTGLTSPLMDNPLEAGMGRVTSRDVTASRDAQRNARDAKILMELVSNAGAVRETFEDVRKIVDEEASILITEKAERQAKMAGPRPLNHQGARVEDVEKKKRNIFHRALKGLSTKGNGDLAKIEDMLVNLLKEVEVLKETSKDQAPASGVSYEWVEEENAG
ncbi:hypothetical protein OQA88_8764 [Cercophora sp. LCS_1]